MSTDVPPYVFAMLQARPDRPHKAQGSTQYWRQCIDISQRAFWLAISQAPPAERGQIIRTVVGEIGKHGAGADFRLILADPVLMLPTTESLESTVATVAQSCPNIDEREYRRLIGIAAKAITERMMDSKRFFDRYYHIVRWSRIFITLNHEANGDITIGGEHMVDGLTSAGNDGAFWYHLREYVLLMYVTDRTDLMVVDTKEEARQHAEQWWAWVQDNTMWFGVSEYEPRRIVTPWPNANFKAKRWIPSAPLPEWGNELIPHHDAELLMYPRVYAEISFRGDANGSGADEREEKLSDIDGECDAQAGTRDPNV
jgi:hypothetical protein